MGDLYASAIGTTVLQLKELPPRPADYDGKLCLFDLKEGVSEAKIRDELRQFGAINSVELGGWPPAVVCFATHAAALAAKRAAARLAHVAGGVDTLYNECSYDGRTGVDGLEDDDGRGWCARRWPGLAHASVPTRSVACVLFGAGVSWSLRQAAS